MDCVVVQDGTSIEVVQRGVVVVVPVPVLVPVPVPVPVVMAMRLSWEGGPLPDTERGRVQAEQMAYPLHR